MLKNKKHAENLDNIKFIKPNTKVSQGAIVGLYETHSNDLTKCLNYEPIIQGVVYELTSFKITLTVDPSDEKAD